MDKFVIMVKQTIIEDIELVEDCTMVWDTIENVVTSSLFSVEIFR